jgi:hypothetical protein
MLQVYNSLRPEVEFMAHQMLDEAGCHPGDSRGAIEALFWGFKNRFRYTPDPWELDLFINCYRAFLVGGGSPDGDLSSGSVWYGDCDDAVISLDSLAYLTAARTGIRRVGAKVVGPGREFVHIYVGLEDASGKLVFLDPTVATAGPGWQAPAKYRKSERFFWFDPEQAQRAANTRLTQNAAPTPEPTERDLDRSSVRGRVNSLVQRVYRSLRDPVTRVTAITMLRESGCPARDDFCDATAMLHGVQSRYQPTGPVGGSVRALGQFAEGGIADDVVQGLVGDGDDAAMTLCSLTLSIGFRSGVRVTPDGQLNAVVQLPRSQSKTKPRKVLDLRLDSDRPLGGFGDGGRGGTLMWYQERH